MGPKTKLLHQFEKKVIFIPMRGPPLLAQRADIVNLDSCCSYTKRDVANSAAALGLHS